jgi:6-pyruvoyltetrahydropterin/6-carboxytetrahydropterin synthase
VEVADLSQVNPSYPKTGMLIDFKDLKAILNAAICKRYDHQCLNDRLENPTAENLVYDILTNVKEQIEAMQYNLKLIKIKVWESDSSFATWRRVG